MPASPCTGVCTIDPVSALCRGCARTLDEIAAWHGAEAEEKLEILKLCQFRLADGGKAP
jgi:Predicted Fe-S protein